MKKNDHYLQDILFMEHNIDVSPYDDVFVQNSLQTRMNETTCGSQEEYSGFLKQHDDERTKLLHSLQISYSAFFRNPLTYAVIEHVLLADFIAGKTRSKEIRIWSAACAAGQEAYSVAILLEEQINFEKHNISYRIFATDRDEQQVGLAKKGTYHADHLANLSLKYSTRWFTQNGACYSVKPALKKHIEFSVFDLFDEKYSSPPASIFGDFDLVLCANLLFYYKAAYRKKIMDKMIESMADDGYLIVGETERDILMNYKFQEVYPYAAIFRKRKYPQLLR